MIVNKLHSSTTSAALGIELESSKLRLILLQNDQELACRKESVKQLLAFAQTNQESIFKGRLRLETSGEGIHVLFKETYMGQLSKKALTGAILKMVENSAK